MVPSRRKQPADPPDDESGESRIERDERTEMSFGGEKNRATAKIGRDGQTLIWAVAWAIAIISTMIALTMLVNMLDKLGVIGCCGMIFMFLLTFGLAFVSQLWP